MAVFNRDKSARFEEIEEYRALLEPPGHYEEAFNVKTIIGAIFVSIVMLPGNIYLNLMIGGGVRSGCGMGDDHPVHRAFQAVLHHPEKTGDLPPVLCDHSPHRGRNGRV